MKSKLLSLAAVAALAIGFASSGAHAQSAKFTAHVNDAGAGMYLLHSGVANTATGPGLDIGESDCESGDTFFDLGDAGGVCVKVDDTDDILNATIKTANKKDLLIGVSLQNALYTETNVKGKNGSSEKAGAEAGILVQVLIDGQNSDGGVAKAYPEQVVFNHRAQTLSATLGGVIESCNVNVEITEDAGVVTDASGSFNVANDCIVTDEEIGLILSTTSANHFNFVAPNLAPGNHEVTVRVKALASAAFLNGFYEVTNLTLEECGAAGGVWDDPTCTFETTDNSATGWAAVAIGTLTVEEVRATNNPDGVLIDLDKGKCYDPVTNALIECI